MADKKSGAGIASSSGLVPEGHSIIARRFNAGARIDVAQVPKGRLNRPSLRYPSLPTVYPALKRRAIVGHPFGMENWRELLRDISEFVATIPRQKSAPNISNCFNP